MLFGLAMAMKQTPWFVLPFVLAGIAGQVRIERGRWGIATAGRYLGIALVAFLVPNAIYIIHSPRAWVSGVLTPFSSHTVPAGQGLVGLTLFLRLGGGSLTAYTLTAAVTFVVLWLVYVTSFPRLRTWTFVIPALALFFATRSFSSYLVILLPLGLLAAATDDDVGLREASLDEGEATVSVSHRAPTRARASRGRSLALLAASCFGRSRGRGGLRRDRPFDVGAAVGQDHRSQDNGAARDG